MMSTLRYMECLMLVALLGSIFQTTDGANTKIMCETFACIGQPFEITCDIEGELKSGIAWSDPGNRNVVSCNSGGECIPLRGYHLVNKTAARQVLRITRVSSSDVGAWRCADGIGQVQPMCNVSALEAPVLSGVKATCDRHGNDDSFDVVCTGITSPGTPAAMFDLKWDGGSRQNVTQNTSTHVMHDLVGSQITCSVVGPSTVCLKDVVTSGSAVCPGAVTSYSVPLIIGVVLAFLVLIVLGADLYRCKAHDEGFVYFLHGKLCRRGKPVPTDELEPKAAPGETDPEKNAPEKKPLLDEKATDKASATVEEETKPEQEDKMADKQEVTSEVKELEPEDKDPDVTPIVEASDDREPASVEAPPIKPRSKIGGEKEDATTGVK